VRLQIVLELLDVVVNRDSTAGEQLLEAEPLHLCQPCRLRQREAFLLKQADGNLLTVLRFTQTRSAENFVRDQDAHFELRFLVSSGSILAI
jgi:hypothetical protein